MNYNIPFDCINNLILKKSKTVILVVGMHRSGTSALTGIFHAFGASVPLAKNTRINPDNPKGHWEHTQANQINDDILRQFNLTWALPGIVDFHKLAPKHLQRLAHFLDIEISQSQQDIVVFKDPRLCLVLPIWIESLGNLGHEIKVVFSFRHPQAAAASLQKRNGMGYERGLFLWLQYNLQAVNAMKGLDGVRCIFPQWMNSVSTLYEQTNRELGLDWSNSWAQCQNSVTSFLDEKLIHNQNETCPNSLMEKMSVDLFGLLRKTKSAIGQIHADPDWESFCEMHLDWLNSTGRLMLDERDLWREKINSIYYLINRNS